MSNNKKSYFEISSYSIIIVVSLLYSYLLGSGIYGFGVDFYNIYNEQNIFYGDFRDFLGWFIATFSINNIHYGVHLTSLILAVGVGFLIRYFFILRGLLTALGFFSVYIIVLHTWPIIMSTSNAMRQGVAMSFLFVSLSLISLKHFRLGFLFAMINIFSHKIGIIFFALIVLSKYFDSRVESERVFLRKHFAYTAVLLFISSFLYLSFFEKYDEDTKIIGGDYRIPFFLICISYIIYFLRKRNRIPDMVEIFLFYSSCLMMTFLFAGLNWEFERFGMVLILIYILLFSRIFDKYSSFIYLIFSYLMLLLMTFATGMYSALE